MNQTQLQQLQQLKRFGLYCLLALIAAGLLGSLVMDSLSRSTQEEFMQWKMEQYYRQ